MEEVGAEVVRRTKSHWTRWETEIDWALRTRWTFEYYRAYVEEGNRPGSEDKKLTDHFLKRLDETISDRRRFWRESPDDAAFVSAYKEFGAKSEAVLGKRNRTNATPKWPVLYHDLERTMFEVWQVRPEDVTVNQVRHALHVLARNSDDGHVKLDQISCEAYGIDYSKLMTLMSASVARVTDLSSEPKVPRNSATDQQPASARDEPDQSVSVESDADLDFVSGAGRNGAVDAYCKFWTCSEASLARAATVDPADLSKWKSGGLPPKTDKLSRIKKALKNNAPPIPVKKRSTDT